MSVEGNSQQLQGLSRERIALERVLRYLWDEEQADYEALPPDGHAGHIFEDLMCLSDWLRRANEFQKAGYQVVVVRGEATGV